MAGNQHQLTPVVGERVVERESGAANARKAREPFLEIPIERGQLLAGIGGRRPVQGHQHASLNLVTEVLILQVAETAASIIEPATSTTEIAACTMSSALRVTEE